MELTNLHQIQEPETVAGIHGGIRDLGSSKLRNLLSKLTLKTAVSIFKICGFIKSMPFCPESKDSLRVKKFAQWWKLVAWHLANWLYCFVAAFQLITYIMVLASGAAK